MKYAVSFLLAVCFIFSASAIAQITPDMARGLTPFASYNQGDIDNYNPANGNLFLKIPLLSYPQRGRNLHLDYYIYYNDKQWQLDFSQVSETVAPLNNWPVQLPQPATHWHTIGNWEIGEPGVLGGGVGAYIARDQHAQINTNKNIYEYSYFGPQDAGPFVVSSTIYSTFVNTPDGGRHYVGDGFIQTCNTEPLMSLLSCPSMPPEVFTSYPATDASGFIPSGFDSNSNLYNKPSIISVTDSSGIMYTQSNISDRNGNSIIASSTGWTDTLGRFIPGSPTGPGATTFPNNTLSYGDFLYSSVGVDPVPGVASANVPPECPVGTSAARIWSVPASKFVDNGTATYYLCYASYHFQTSFNLPVSEFTNWNLSNVAEASNSSGWGDALMLTAVVLPNGNSYTFKYDQYLSLIELGLPTGGNISYTWQNVTFKLDLRATLAPISRALSSRTVTPGDGQPSSTTTYHWYTSPSINSGTGASFPAYSVVTDANGNDTEYTLGGPDDAGNVWTDYVIVAEKTYSGCSPHDTDSSVTCNSGTGKYINAQTYALTPVYSGGATFGTPSYIPQPLSTPPTKPYQTTNHVASTQGDVQSKVLESIVPNYGSCDVYTYPVNMINSVQSEAGIIPGVTGTAPGATFVASSNCYSAGKMSSRSYYDYGSPGSSTVGPRIKTEYTSYVWQPSLPSGFPSNMTTYPNNSSYLSANLIGLVSQDEITDSSGIWTAKTDYIYDESPSPSGTFGNLTSVKRYDTPSSSVISSSQYNSGGVVTLLKDSDGNQISYAGFMCSGSLPTIVTKAYSSSTTKSETWKYGYDCNTGKVTSATDPNLQTTNYTYADFLNRVTSVAYPDGGGVSVNYNGDTWPLTMAVTTLSGEAAGSSVTTTTYDGLMRILRTQLPSGAYTANGYNNIGQLCSISNASYQFMPLGLSCSGSQNAQASVPADGIIYISYDALGRKVLETEQDGTTQSWSYSGNVVTSTNENGNQWQRTSDALGRLTLTVEPNGTRTYYVYDALGNLTCAAQDGATSGTFTSCAAATASWRPRTFTYDGLSRLLTSTNPETGSTGYTYDANGNVLTKTDARGVVAHHSYDALNRLISKTYTNASAGTMSSCYQYDTAANGIGYLSAKWTQTGSCSSAPPSNYQSLRVYGAYDAMGRTLIEQQCAAGYCTSASIPSQPPANCTTLSSATGLQYCYDLVGNLLAYSNGVTTSTAGNYAQRAMLFSQTFDAAGRLGAVGSSWSDSTHPATLFKVNEYTPFNALSNWTFGTSQIYGRSYDERLRVIQQSFRLPAMTCCTPGTGTVNY